MLEDLCSSFFKISVFFIDFAFCVYLRADLVILEFKLLLDFGQCAVHILDASFHRLKLLNHLIVQTELQFVQIFKYVLLCELVGFQSAFRFCLEDGLDRSSTSRLRKVVPETAPGAFTGHCETFAEPSEKNAIIANWQATV